MDNNPRGQQAIEISGAFTGLAAITVFLRLYTRFFIVRYSGVEDYFVALAMLCSIGLTICIGIQAKYGMGKHLKDLEESDTLNSGKAFWASLIVYYLSLGLTKSSILLQYRRVFPTKSFQIACWSTMGVVIVYTIWTVFGSIFACIPVSAFWTHAKPARCINQFAMWFTNAAINILTDFAIIILPMPVIRSLNLARRQKQALIGIFAIGGFVCVVSILRLQSLVAISNSDDPTYDNPPAATWSSVETSVGIICSCLPCLRPLMARCFPGIFSSAHKYGPHSGPAYGRNTYGRNTYARQSSAVGNAYPLQSKASHGSSEDESRDERLDIQVTTEVHVRVEGDDGQSIRKDPKELTVEHGSSSRTSTETLVRDAVKMV